MAAEPIRDAAGLPSAFAYEHTDVPPGMTLTAWRRPRVADRGRAARSSSRPTRPAAAAGLDRPDPGRVAGRAMSRPTGTRAAQDGQRLRGDEAALYDRHHRALVRAVARTVRVSPAPIEDACQTAWTILLRRQPDRGRVFAWLRVVAVHEAYRLSAVERRDARLDDLAPVAETGDWTEIIPDRRALDEAVEARRALRALAGLPDRERRYLTMLVAGHRCAEIVEVAGASYTNVLSGC